MERLRLMQLVPGALLIAALGLAGCDVEQTEEGELPDVSVEGGNLPEYDVDGPDIDVGTQEKQVTVPDVDVDVDSEERTITVPDIDVNLPDDEAGQGDIDVDRDRGEGVIDEETPQPSSVPVQNPPPLG